MSAIGFQGAWRFAIADFGGLARPPKSLAPRSADTRQNRTTLQRRTRSAPWNPEYGAPGAATASSAPGVRHRRSAQTFDVSRRAPTRPLLHLVRHIPDSRGRSAYAVARSCDSAVCLRFAGPKTSEVWRDLRSLQWRTATPPEIRLRSY